jgi:tRNA threonylcarbamoyladenosine biosynthesis protein TsaE
LKRCGLRDMVRPMDLLLSVTSRRPEETEEVGRLLGQILGEGHLVALVGELGAGKTCFVRGVAEGLGVDPAAGVSSPTFTLVNEYPGRIPLYHIDLYRLTEICDLEEIGLDDYLRREGACLVEWFDRFPEAFPESYLEVRLQVTGEMSRRIEVRASDSTHRALGLQWVAKVRRTS